MEIPCKIIFIKPECIANYGPLGAILEANEQIRKEFLRCYDTAPITAENGGQFKLVLYRVKE